MPEKHNDIEMIQERDVLVKMRDGVHLSVDVYRPTASGKYPALFATSLHNKDNQGPDIADGRARDQEVDSSEDAEITRIHVGQK